MQRRRMVVLRQERCQGCRDGPGGLLLPAQRLRAALLDTSCVSTIATCLTARPRSLPGLLPMSDRRTFSPDVRLDGHFIHFQSETGSIGPSVPDAPRPARVSVPRNVVSFHDRSEVIVCLRGVNPTIEPPAAK